MRIELVNANTGEQVMTYHSKIVPKDEDIVHTHADLSAPYKVISRRFHFWTNPGGVQEDAVTLKVEQAIVQIS
tara:strand:+ start:1398 stop:1616 length:219 start_codon:yes stop_codon:yes gene_type:complete